MHNKRLPTLTVTYCYKHGKSLPSNVSLMVGKRVLHEMTDSSPVWTPDLGVKLGDFGDEIWDLKGTGILSISLLGEEIRHECARSFHVTSRPAGETI
ncbi:hypothetical protein AVEN_188263-1 [Araneus ventricosus]|uniref:Uncharacterized protein n=1 Tax=Araneus ventricosus TaxID=182803 RepID=A0A4Y2KRL9_ARAVE|nr:hypothetical protein AVEN_188263-1 [Araneus ventricosus]